MPIPSTHLSLLSALTAGGRREEAWAAFQARYRDVILGWCRRRELPPDCAEDLTQEVLLKLFQELPRYAYNPSQGRFRSWLKAVVNNALTDCWRRQQRRPELGGVGGTAFLEQLGNLESPDAADDLSGVIECRVKTTAAEVLERVRAKLKETTWQSFCQTMVERRPAAEVAAELGLTVGAIHKANWRIKQMMLLEYRNVQPTSCPPPELS
jgi:RNA polymerase sigma-70 factor (ECF subfamily)